VQRFAIVYTSIEIDAVIFLFVEYCSLQLMMVSEKIKLLMVFAVVCNV